MHVEKTRDGENAQLSSNVRLRLFPPKTLIVTTFELGLYTEALTGKCIHIVDTNWVESSFYANRDIMTSRGTKLNLCRKNPINLVR